MKILRDPKRLTPCVLVLGMFDGVHRGHQALLMRGGELAQEMDFPLCVLSFEPHPLRVLAPHKAPPLLNTLPEKARIMQSFGVDYLSITTFNRERADQSPEDFMEEMVSIYAPVVVVCGFNFTFGKGGAGTGKMLREYGKKHGFRTVVVPEVIVDGATVSSTRIRKVLAEGDIPTVNRLLGTGYTLSGKVEGGKQLGRTMGFPTANVALPKHKALPAFGVYDCWLETADGAYRPAVVNVGRHPTLPEGNVTVEAHVLTDEPIDLYGQHVRLSFMRFQRAEKRFASKDELQEQITRDVEEAKAYFAKMV